MSPAQASAPDLRYAHGLGKRDCLAEMKGLNIESLSQSVPLHSQCDTMA